MNYGDETLSVIDLNRKRVIATLPIGKHPQHVAVDVARNRVFVAMFTRTTSLPSTVLLMQWRAKSKQGSHPYAITIASLSGKAFVANYETPWITALAFKR